ncbi:MAG: sodium:alanine symporter family protein, partial [Elusimicrobiaceae bacterium]|nr:sodium:alanine symporter family protein [Elusimicrobiaceae bacterium]
MEWFTNVLIRFNAYVWGVPMLLLLVGTSLYFTWKLRFIQRHLLRAIVLSLKESRSAGVISSFGALVVALAAMVGTGNIVGVAAAISTGGPGALFWMIVCAFFAMATKYAEAVLAVKYREKNVSGEYVGGPMYVLKNGLGLKKWAIVFAIATALMGFADALIQTNSLASIYHSVFQAPVAITTLVLVCLTAMVILGGVKKIAAVCKYLVPVMAILYIALCLVIIALHVRQIPWALACILKSAFSGTALVGGAIGITVKEAIRYGVARGVLSNEAGSGSGAIAAAAAQTPNSVRQGLVSATTVFWDTLVICLVSGITVVIAGDW